MNYGYDVNYSKLRAICINGERINIIEGSYDIPNLGELPKYTIFHESFHNTDRFTIISYDGMHDYKLNGILIHDEVVFDKLIESLKHINNILNELSSWMTKHFTVQQKHRQIYIKNIMIIQN